MNNLNLSFQINTDFSKNILQNLFTHFGEVK